MIDTYKVLLSNRIFEQAKNDKDLRGYILNYMQRYPHYVFLYEENGFAICERKGVKS